MVKGEWIACGCERAKWWIIAQMEAWMSASEEIWKIIERLKKFAS